MCPKRRLFALLFGAAILGAISAADLSAPGLRRIEWQAVPEARAYQVSVQDAAGAGIFEGRTERPRIDLALDPGTYRMRIVVLNKFLKPATESPWFEILVVKAVRPLVAAVGPTSFPAGTPEARILVSGSGLSADTRATLIQGSDAIAGILAPIGSGPDGAGIAFVFDLGAAAAGAYDLFLENPGNMRATSPAALRLIPPETWPRPPSPALPPGPRGLPVSLIAALPEPSVPEPPPPAFFESSATVSATSIDGASAAPGLSDASPSKAAVVEATVPAATDPTEPDPAELLSPGAGHSIRRFPKPPARGIWIDAGWAGGLLLDPGFAARYGTAFAGGGIGMAASATMIPKAPPSLRILSLELLVEGRYYPGQGAASGAASFLAGTGTAGLALRSDFAFPVNAVARLGGGLALSDLSSTSPLGTSSAFSLDPALRAGLGLRVTLGKHYLEFGAEWLGVFYVDSLLNGLRGGLLFGFGLSRSGGGASGD